MAHTLMNAARTLGWITGTILVIAGLLTTPLVPAGLLILGFALRNLSHDGE